ncbi:MAG: methylenetetrahydrofolate--tRNA-(uracil(54)-C(5))-methyltransferase (FADH(2)-oxidizing) TrmFO [Fimbriimonadales bacterium]|nr:methylenetetrahydrofolate--tRNA-(uracil(54)-C(5))-methyltransferase (FADH(2)-oxidizing) TrmFO [Fimbriimonadales bacterium]
MRAPFVVVVGGGLAGSECAWNAAQRGVRVRLYEMRPQKLTPAHKTGDLAELVCSNSFKSEDPDTPPGLLKQEMSRLGSLTVTTAQKHRLEGGQALVVDRSRFTEEVTRALSHHPLVEIIREEWHPELLIPHVPHVIATGPLTSEAVANWISHITGTKHLYFYDAVSPTLTAESIDFTTVWEQSRYNKGDAGYLNCPFTKEEYYAFVEALRTAERAPIHDFEKNIPYFEACLPIEIVAERGPDALRFSTLKPVGLKDPRTGRRPFAVLQLRPENREKTLYSMVACQTRLKWPEQKRVFQMVPGLQNAEFVRYGVIHRNTYLDAPRILLPDLRLAQPEPPETPILFAGQITGVEGYMESAATGILAGINSARLAQGLQPLVPPRETALGCLIAHITNTSAPEYQPMNINWGLFPPITEPKLSKAERRKAQIQRAREAFSRWMTEHSLSLPTGNPNANPFAPAVLP